MATANYFSWVVPTIPGKPPLGKRSDRSDNHRDIPTVPSIPTSLRPEELIEAACRGLEIIPAQFKAICTETELEDIANGEISIEELRIFAVSFAEGLRTKRIVIHPTTHELISHMTLFQWKEESFYGRKPCKENTNATSSKLIIQEEDKVMKKNIATIKKNTREEMRIYISEYNNHDLVAMRIWAQNDSGKKVPTKKGITINVKLVPKILEALTETEKVLKGMGLLGDDT